MVSSWENRSPTAVSKPWKNPDTGTRGTWLLAVKPMESLASKPTSYYEQLDGPTALSWSPSPTVYQHLGPDPEQVTEKVR